MKIQLQSAENAMGGHILTSQNTLGHVIRAPQGKSTSVHTSFARPAVQAGSPLMVLAVLSVSRDSLLTRLGAPPAELALRANTARATGAQHANHARQAGIR